MYFNLSAIVLGTFDISEIFNEKNKQWQTYPI